MDLIRRVLIVSGHPDEGSHLGLDQVEDASDGACANLSFVLESSLDLSTFHHHLAICVKTGLLFDGAFGDGVLLDVTVHDFLVETVGLLLCHLVGQLSVGGLDAVSLGGANHISEAVFIRVIQVLGLLREELLLLPGGILLVLKSPGR